MGTTFAPLTQIHLRHLLGIADCIRHPVKAVRAWFVYELFPEIHFVDKVGGSNN